MLGRWGGGGGPGSQQNMQPLSLEIGTAFFGVRNVCNPERGVHGGRGGGGVAILSLRLNV